MRRLATAVVIAIICIAAMFFLWPRQEKVIHVPVLDLGPIAFSDPELLWPYKTKGVTIEKITASFDWHGHECFFDGSLKKATLQWQAICPAFTAVGHGTLVVTKSTIREINLDIEELTFTDWQVRRSEGWLSLTWQQGWHLTGEIDAGFFDMKAQSFAQPHVTLQQDAHAQTLDFTGVAVPQQQPVSLAIKNDAVDISYAEQIMKADSVDWQDKLHEILQPKIVEEKEEKPVTESVKKPAPKPVTPQVIKTTPTSYQVDWDSTVKNSIFAGFHYNKPLKVFPKICTSDKEQLCRVAHGHKGVLTYYSTQPPGYFSRISDIQQRTQLQTALYELQIDNLRLYSTEGGTVTRLVLRGHTSYGQPVQLDLNVEQ